MTDAIVAAALVVAMPFVEWLVHSRLLHAEPMMWRGRAIVLVAAGYGRCHADASGAVDGMGALPRARAACTEVRLAASPQQSTPAPPLSQRQLLELTADAIVRFVDTEVAGAAVTAKWWPMGRSAEVVAGRPGRPEFKPLHVRGYAHG